MLLRKSYLTVLEDMLGITITRSLSIRLLRGSYAVATTTMVAVRGSLLSATAMVVRIPAVRGGLCCLPNSCETAILHICTEKKKFMT